MLYCLPFCFRESLWIGRYDQSRNKYFSNFWLASVLLRSLHALLYFAFVSLNTIYFPLQHLLCAHKVDGAIPLANACMPLVLQRSCGFGAIIPDFAVAFLLGLIFIRRQWVQTFPWSQPDCWLLVWSCSTTGNEGTILRSRWAFSLMGFNRWHFRFCKLGKFSTFAILMWLLKCSRRVFPNMVSILQKSDKKSVTVLSFISWQLYCFYVKWRLLLCNLRVCINYAGSNFKSF